jgi:hypothetical protein
VLPVRGRALRVVCAERDGREPLAVMLVDERAQHAWMIDRGTRRLAEERMPPMRPASVGAALAMAAGALAYPPLAGAAVGYAGVRALRREFRRRMLHAEVEMHLREALLEGIPSAPQPDRHAGTEPSGALLARAPVRRRP